MQYQLGAEAELVLCSTYSSIGTMQYMLLARRGLRGCVKSAWHKVGCVKWG